MPKLSPSRAFGFLMLPPGPQRVLGFAALVNTFGFGLIMTSITLYFTRVVHLSATQVGVGFTISGVIGLVSSVPVGDLADRRGIKETVQVTMLLQAIATFLYLLIRSFTTFVIIATAEMLVTNANMAATGALVRRVGGEDAVAFRSKMRAISNLGVSLGALSSGVAIGIGTANAYRALLIGNGVTFVIACAIMLRLPHYAPLPKPESGPRWAALADKPFVVYAALAGLMSIQFFLIELPLPLWVVNHTQAPRWTVPLFLLINTFLVVLLQVRASRDVKTVRQGGSALRQAGAIFLLSCAGIGLASGLPGWAALLLLIAAVVVHTVGELRFSAGSIAFDFGMAPEHSQGQYQGLAGIGTGVGSAAAPVILLGLCLSFGKTGWLGLGAAFALLGLAGPAVGRWGERTRPSAPEASDPQLASAPQS